jgi:hypothetical protein
VRHTGQGYPQKKEKIKHITQIQVRVPLWLSGKMETTTFIKKYIIDEKNNEAENGGYLCPCPLSVGTVLNIGKKYI